MKQFIYDMIHMTEGEKFISYWWLWLAIVLTTIVISVIVDKFKKPKRRETPDEFFKRVFGGGKK